MLICRGAAAALFCAAMFTATTARADDADDLVGVWVPVGFESKGNALTADQLKSIAPKLTFTITKDRISAPANGSTEITYQLGPEAYPKTIDTVDVNGPYRGELRRGIYELKGDMLRICMGAKEAPRPQRFTTRPGEGSGDTMFTFERKKEPAP